MKRQSKPRMIIFTSLILCVSVLLLGLYACGKDKTAEIKSGNNASTSSYGKNSTGTSGTAETETNTEANNASSGANTTANTSASTASASITYTVNYESNDYYTDWKKENPGYITLEGESIKFTGNGAYVNGNTITILSGGTYVVSGKLNDGSIVIDVMNKGIVKLVLNGAEIHCSSISPIYVKNAGKTIISLADGTTNKITDGESYILPDSSSDEPNATIFSKDDLTINGNGTLTVDANYNNAITCKDDLKITGGNFNINAADDGLMGRDLLAIKDGNFNIEAGGDGIKSTNDTETQKGIIVIEGGTFNIEAGADGIQAETSAYINNGEFNITTGGGSANSSENINTAGNTWGKWGRSDQGSSTSDTTQSAKGIKAAVDVIINAGTFSINSSDDAIHSNSNIIVNNGEISISSGDDGMHSDTTLTINGGEISISKSYEGIESSQININGGEIEIASRDDGINVVGGNDASSFGRPGQNTFNSLGDDRLNINSGSISINAYGDGMDINGPIYMTDGTVIISGPVDNANGSLDYAGVFDISGGILVAAGSAGMAMAPSSDSSQCSILMYYSQTQSAGTRIQLKDSSGKNIVDVTPPKNYQTVVISSPELKQGTQYTLYANSSKVVSFELPSTTTYLSESGVTESRQMEGMPFDRNRGGKIRRP